MMFIIKKDKIYLDIFLKKFKYFKNLTFFLHFFYIISATQEKLSI